VLRRHRPGEVGPSVAAFSGSCVLWNSTVEVAVAAKDMPDEVRAITTQLEKLLDTKDKGGNVAGNAVCGVYAFYDYDGEPIYVGQTYEKLRSRIRRHLTNQRTDAVAMNVLDPFEVADIEMWPFYVLDAEKPDVRAETLTAAEYTVYQQLIKASTFGAILNEKEISAGKKIELPPSVRGRIIPEPLYTQRRHADVRIARRASTIASLARVVSERDVQKGLRRTLLTQVRRLDHLAKKRLEEVGGEVAAEKPGEETGESTE
jgi:hypothetical protein